MHGERETTRTPRVICTLVHGVFLAIGAWILVGGGGALVRPAPADAPPQSPGLARHLVLVAFGVVLLVRMGVGLFHLLARRFGWEEMGGVLLALLVYQVGFALLAAGSHAPLGTSDAVAIVLFVAGSLINTGSEWQRKRFKDDPRHRGRLYTQGLFRLARHVNYFGDMLWVTAWALVTRNPWALIVPVALTLAFIFVFMPSLSRHLRSRYGAEYEVWEGRTRALIPFVY